MAEELSKSAKKRLAKKNRDEVAAAEEQAKEAAAAAAAAPKAKAKAEPKQAAQPAAKSEAAAPKAKAKAKAKDTNPICACGNPFTADSRFCNKCGAKREDATAVAEPKAAAKAAAKSEVAPKAAAKSEAAPKAEGKKAAKAKKAETAPVAPPAPKVENNHSFTYDDDGTGGDWEKASSATKKVQKQKDKKAKDAEPPQPAASAPTAACSSKGGKQKSNAPEQEKVVNTDGMSANQAMIAKLEAQATAKAHAAAAAREAAKGAGKGKGKDEEPEDPERAKAVANFTSVTISVPSDKIARIIGPKGTTLKMITEKTGVDRIDTLGEICTIIGNPENVKQCEVALIEMRDKGFMSIMYENFTEASVMVHPSMFPDIIGQKGAIIRKIKEELTVEINIPSSGVTKDPKAKDGWGKKKYPVSIAGSAASVETAKEVVNDIVLYKHHKITHEGVVHAEMEIEEWLYRFIIGPKGSEMRHIQNSFHVGVNIPRETNKDTGACPNLLIVGQEGDVAKAKTYIEKLVYNAEHEPKGGQGREDKAADDERNKGDDEVDPQAAQYLYKRAK